MKQPSQSHPIRLAAWMVGGAALGSLFWTPILDSFEPWDQYPNVMCNVIGATLGLIIELCRRLD